MAYRAVQQRIVRATNHVSGSDVVYVENPKVACSNMKWALVGAFCPENSGRISNIHDRRETMFISDYRGAVRILIDPSSQIFSIVRHPRNRFISAYFDKMHKGRDESVWKIIAAALNLEVDRIHDPKTILDRIYRHSPQDLDSHIAKQVTNIFFGHINFFNIYHLEELSPDATHIKVGSCSLELINRQSQSTEARIDRSLFDDEALEMIDVVYSDDYAAFGYDPKEPQPVRDIATPDKSSMLLDFLASDTPIQFLLDFFADGPRKLSYLETGAIIDIISKRDVWHLMPHHLIDFIIARNAILQGDNAERFSSRFSGFPQA